MVFLPRTNFLANRSPVRGGVRANSGEPGRTPPNSGERSPYSGERSPEFGGVSVLANRWRIRAEFARVDRSSSREFARVRPSSRRTTVRRVYRQWSSKMVLTTFESSKIDTLESPSELNEIRPIQAANELPLLTFKLGAELSVS